MTDNHLKIQKIMRGLSSKNKSFSSILDLVQQSETILFWCLCLTFKFIKEHFDSEYVIKINGLCLPFLCLAHEETDQHGADQSDRWFLHLSPLLFEVCTWLSPFLTLSVSSLHLMRAFYLVSWDVTRGKQCLPLLWLICSSYDSRWSSCVTVIIPPLRWH